MQYYTMKDYTKLMVYVYCDQNKLENKITTLREESEEYILEIKDRKENKKTQKPKIHHKHDKMFRKILSNEKEVAKLINQELDPEKEVKVEDLEKYETKFVNSRYEDKEADIVYKLKDKEVFFLIEHQTKVDKEMPNRIAEYSLNIMNTRKAKNEKINPVVSPIVIYAGIEKWTARTSLEEGQEEFRHRKGSSSIIRYNLVDIRNVEEAIEKGTAIARMSVIERLKTKEEIMETVDKFAENIKTKEEREEFAEEIEYILEDKLEEKDLKRIKEIILKEEGDGRMSHVHEVLRRDAERERKKAIAEGLAEGKARGMEEGRREGRREGRKEGILAVAKKMLKQKFDIDTITQITGLKKEQFM